MFSNVPIWKVEVLFILYSFLPLKKDLLLKKLWQYFIDYKLMYSVSRGSGAFEICLLSFKVLTLRSVIEDLVLQTNCTQNSSLSI